MLSRESKRICTIAGSRAPVTTCPSTKRRFPAASTRDAEGRIVILTFPPGYVNALKAHVRYDKALLKRRERKGEREREREVGDIISRLPRWPIITENYLITTIIFSNIVVLSGSLAMVRRAFRGSSTNRILGRCSLRRDEFGL